MSKITVIGAGKTGRGFIGRLLAESGSNFCFVDKDESLINDLSKNSYQIHFFGNVRNPLIISNYQTATWDTVDFSETELIFVSVGVSNLSDVGIALKERLRTDKYYYIITCENASDPAGKLKNTLQMDNVFVSESTVFCTTIEANGRNISSENYPYLQCNADLLNGYQPPIQTIRPISQFGNFLTRKLFTYNAASCIIAYLGWFYGYSNYAEAANDERILKMLDENYAITNRVLCREFGYDEKDQAEFALLSRNKFTDKTIVDTVARNAREPQRKLGKAERVIGPMLLMEKYEEDSTVLQLTAAAMLLYENDGEDEWKKICSDNSPAEILEKIGGLKRESILSKNILAKYEEMK